MIVKIYYQKNISNLAYPIREKIISNDIIGCIKKNKKLWNLYNELSLTDPITFYKELEIILSDKGKIKKISDFKKNITKM